MAVNDTISQAEYNNIRNKLTPILGTGSGNSGYGQNLNSSTVAAGNKVTINEWANLRYDIINAYVHQNGTTPTTVSVAAGDKIRFSAVDAPVTTYDALVDGIVTNKWNVGAGQSATNTPASPASTTWPGAYGSSWTSKITCTINVSWANSNLARYFFNTGGQIRITASRTGGSSTSQCTSWTNILSAAGTQGFGGNNPGTGTSPSDGQNWYRLTNSFQQYYSRSGSSPYGSNTYRLSAKVTDVANNASGTAAASQFYVEFIDNYTDPGPLGPPYTDDAVDGTFTVSVSLLYATGVRVPSGTGSFSVTLPTVSIGTIAP